MTDRPIIFSAPMVRALLEGRKSQTRRKLRVPPPFDPSDDIDAPVCAGFIEPQYRRGDRLYVRESVVRQETDQGVGFQTYAADTTEVWPLTQWYHKRKSIPSIHMPRWASRLTLIVTDVRVHRLQDISEADAWAEGCNKGDPTDNGGFFPAEERHPKGGTIGWDNARDWFADLWNSLHGPDAWDANPWVAAVSFTVHRCNIDQMEST